MSEVAVERPVASPCVSICALDEQDICTGCQRTVAEIGRVGADGQYRASGGAEAVP
jgi:Predicted Fe-S protein